jgi:uncharacterized protein
MRIHNATRKQDLSPGAKICKSLISQARGLMFRRRTDLVFVLKSPRRVPLHMWFVFYPIDVLYLDADRKVVEKVEGFRPFSLYNPKSEASYILELRAGVTKGTRVGDTIIIS